MESGKLISTFLLALAASVLSLAVALIAQYGLGLMPCHLCIAQRVPYAVVVVLSLAGMAKPAWHRWIIYLIVIAFITDGGIAAYHSAVEKHLVSGPSGCTASPSLPGQSIDDFIRRIKNAPVVACDQPQWEFHGITMAVLNMLWSFALAGGTLLLFRKESKDVKTAG